MAYDFRASQIRTNKIVASGSTGTSASIMLYSHEDDGVPPLRGNLDASFDTSAIGSDTFLFVSGSEEKRTVIGGGLTLSGTIQPLQGLPIGDIGITSYADGLFEDWAGSTTVTTAIHEINLVLKALAPSRPPNLSSISSNTTGVTAKLIVDDTHPFAGYTAIPSVNADETYGNNGNILGVITSGTDLTGYLASNVSLGPGEPYPSYIAKALNKGNLGTLRLYLNDVIVRAIDLTNPSAVNDAGTGFALSEALPVLFSTTGIAFDGFKYRTGTWRIAAADQINGYNTLKVEHYIDALNTYTTNTFEWFSDAGGPAIAYNNEQTSDLRFTAPRYMSGVKYHTAGNFVYALTSSNVYGNSVYSINPVTFTTTYGLQSISSEAIPASLGIHTTDLNYAKNVLFQTSGVRLIDGNVTVRTVTPTVFSGSATSTGASISGLLIDNVNDTATTTNETFTSETYRLPSNLDFSDKTLTTPVWDSSISLRTGGAGYNDGLQVAESRLIKPYRNYTTISNGPVSNVDYSSNMGSEDRTYYRMFMGTDASANFVMRLNGSGAVIVHVVDIFSAANQMKVEFRAPTQTGWLCAYDDFVSGQYSDGSGGRAASFGVGRALNTNWGLTIGIKNIVNTNYKIYLRITVPSNFSGYLSSISFTFM
jgi:hypothetical protein